jgi:2-polyprenyl-3-methyl-5-hydroxy-6-metoxy-1,4-benzoquinol methylase
MIPVFLQNLRGWLAALVRLYSTRIQVFAQKAQLQVVEQQTLAQQTQIVQLEKQLVARIEQQHLLLQEVRQQLQNLKIQNDCLDQELRLLKVQTKSEATAIAPNNFDFDRFYTAFEDRFRGSMEDIKSRLQVYLPYVQRAIVETQTNRVLDIGCGRGEWLELLQAQNISAVGVDMNTDMVRKCNSRGLEAHCADAITYLRAMPKASVAVVTGFHIIEHLPFPTMIAMIDAAFEALCENGIVIFETPNPENLNVGACTFYYDPTHLHPIVPAFAEFTVLQRGFKVAEIVRLHPRHTEQLQDSSEVALRLNEIVYGPQDFAVIAKK